MLNLQAVRTEIISPSRTVVAVDGVTLDVQPGETFAIVGESGSGKSITAMSIARLLPENARIASGSVSLNGTNLAELPEYAMREFRGRRISMIFQEPGSSLNPVLTIGRQIIEVIEAHTALRGAAARARAIEWLGRVGIPEASKRFDAYPFQLSGGQKQRVMIAIALAAEPELLIADEPTTALDVTVQKQILDLLLSLQRERGMAMLLITHDLGVVSQVADRVALMYAGQIVEVAETRTLFARPMHPYARQLLGALPSLEKRGQPLAAIPGSVPALDQPFIDCRFSARCRYATDRCRTEAPAMFTVDSSRDVRCFAYAPERAVALIDRRPDVETPRDAHSTITTPSALLTVVDLQVSFPIRSGLLRRVTGKFAAVDGISFEVPTGRTLALVGESGCGKTTTGKAVIQLLRRIATVSGSAHLNDIDLMHAQGDALRRLRKDIQIVFQDPFASLNPRMRVGEILTEGIESLRPEIASAARLPRVADLLDQVGLPKASLTRYPHEFSGGQRQRIAIARALAVDPKLIICDEPTSALDMSVQAQILNLLRSLQRNLGLSYLFITHNLGVVQYIADEVAVMRGGKIVERGSAESILENPQHEYTRTLLSSVMSISLSP